MLILADIKACVLFPSPGLRTVPRNFRLGSYSSEGQMEEWRLVLKEAMPRTFYKIMSDATSLSSKDDALWCV